MKFSFLLCVSFLSGLLVVQGDVLTRPFLATEKPRSISIHATNGSVVVIGDDRQLVSATLGSWPSDFLGKSFERPSTSLEGRGDIKSAVSLGERDNALSVSFQARGRSKTLYLWIPKDANLRVSNSGDGSIAVRNTQGEVEVESPNGQILLDQIWGPVIAHALNQDLWVKFAALVPGRPNYLSSLNGNLFVVLPEGADASFDLDFFNGEVETSIPITLIPGGADWKVSEPEAYEPSRTAESRRRGTHFKIKNHNGNIKITDYKPEKSNEQ